MALFEVFLSGDTTNTWDTWGHLYSMCFLTLVLCSVCFYYSKSLRKVNGCYSEMKRITFLIFTVIRWIRKTTQQILGDTIKESRNGFFVSFFIYIISFFWFSNIISILGFENMGNYVLIPASIAAIVFLGTVVLGIVYRGWGFFGDYLVWLKYKGQKIFPLVDPLKLVGEVSKILSLTCRLWGNTLAGSLILFVLYQFSKNLFSMPAVSHLGPIMMPLFVFPLHIYFDIVDGTIQPMIFMMLTICYWALARHGEGVKSEASYDIKSNKVEVEEQHDTQYE